MKISTLLAALTVLALAPIAGAQTVIDDGTVDDGTTTPAPDPRPEDDENPPTLASVSPDASSVVGSSVTVEGEASDDIGVARVEYRVQGDTRWREALISDGELDDSGDEVAPTSVNYMFRARLRSSANHTRIEIRVIDTNENESDYLTRKFRRR